MDISTSNSAESQIDFDPATSQLIPTDKPLQNIRSKDSSTNTIEEGKKAFAHVIIQSLKNQINSLESQFKDKWKTIDRLFNLNSCQRSCNSTKRNHQEQKSAENVKGLPTSTTDIKACVSTNNNEDALTENNHIQIQNNSKSDLNRRDKLLKNDDKDKEKQVSNIRPD